MEGNSLTLGGEFEAVKVRLDRLDGGSSALGGELEALGAQLRELAEHQAQAQAECREHADKILLTESKLADVDAAGEGETRQRLEDQQRIQEQLQGQVQDSEARLRQLLLGVEAANARESEERHAEMRQVTVEAREASAQFRLASESAVEQHRRMCGATAESAEECRRLQAEWQSAVSQLQLPAEPDGASAPQKQQEAARSGLLRGSQLPSNVPDARPALALRSRYGITSSASSLSASSPSAGTAILERLRSRASAEAHRSAASGATATAPSLRQSLQVASVPALVGATRQLEAAARSRRDADGASAAGEALSTCGSSPTGSPRLRSEALTSWIARGSATPFKDASLFAPVPSGASSTTASTLSAGGDDADGLLRRALLPMARQVMPPGEANPV
jgi:hypothetical protein